MPSFDSLAVDRVSMPWLFLIEHALVTPVVPKDW